MARPWGPDPLAVVFLAATPPGEAKDLATRAQSAAAPPPAPGDPVYRHCELHVQVQCKPRQRGGKRLKCRHAKLCVNACESPPTVCGRGVEHTVLFRVVDSEFYPLQCNLITDDEESGDEDDVKERSKTRAKNDVEDDAKPKRMSRYHTVPVPVPPDVFAAVLRLAQGWVRSCNLQTAMRVRPDEFRQLGDAFPRGRHQYPRPKIAAMGRAEYHARRQECAATTLCRDAAHLVAACFGRPNQGMYNRQLYYTGTTGVALAWPWRRCRGAACACA